MTVVEKDRGEDLSLSLGSLGSLPRLSGRTWRRWLVVVTLLLVVAAVVLGVLAGRAQGLSDARDAAAANAKKRLPVLLSYDHGSLREDLDKAVAQTTGGFREEYRKVVDTTVEPTALKKKVDTTATVSGVGVVEAERDRVVVLAFITQTTSVAGGAPTVSGSRVEVTMVPVDGTWLIEDLKPV